VAVEQERCDCAGAGAATAPVGRAEGHAVVWRAARRTTGARTKTRNCERRDRQLEGPNAPGWWRVRNGAATSVRWAVGEATLWALALGDVVISAKSRVPEVSLRWRRGLLVAVRSLPWGAARGNVRLATKRNLPARELLA